MGCQYTLTSELYWQDCSDYDIEVCLYDGSCVGYGTGDSAKYLDWSGDANPGCDDVGSEPFTETVTTVTPFDYDETFTIKGNLYDSCDCGDPYTSLTSTIENTGDCPILVNGILIMPLESHTEYGDVTISVVCDCPITTQPPTTTSTTTTTTTVIYTTKDPVFPTQPPVTGSTSPRPINPPKQEDFPLNLEFDIRTTTTTTTTLPPIFTTTPRLALKYINKCETNSCNDLGF